MREIGLLLCAGLAPFLLSPFARGGEESKKEAQLKWAKGVASDFLDTLREFDRPHAEHLMCAEYKKQLADSLDLGRWLQQVYDAGLRKKQSITDEHISPDQDEASFKGVLSGDKQAADYTVRVIHEKESGKWRVNFFRYKLRETEEPKK